LVNAITRAAVMAESDVIQATDIRLEQEAVPKRGSRPGRRRGGRVSCSARWTSSPPPPPAPARRSPRPRRRPRPGARPAPPRARPPARLNERQRKAYPEILRRGEISRQAYQDLVGGGLPARTAIYDLQDMCQEGVAR
jgi:hypothetical protein